MSLNPNAKLYGRKTLLEMFDRSPPRDRVSLEASERELEMPWALYHVRRLFLLSGSGKRRPVMRSTERVDLGRPQQLARRLISVSERHRVDVEHDPLYGRALLGPPPREGVADGGGRYSEVGSSGAALMGIPGIDHGCSFSRELGDSASGMPSRNQGCALSANP
ncbi:hypothetical protein ACF08N_36510 [Streptomyces sp. NPDC015127]|uniref:hypothetical protein n=1 Tax=Streptomyces sp. NPDC015127 TaxID=3364939 RepID=UPI0036FA3059